MQKNYELLYIVHPDLEGSIEKITEKVAGFVVKAGGKVTSQEDLGKKKLAYQIAKNDFGIYSLVYFDIESTKLSDVERDLRLSEEIMRSLIVVVPVVSPVTLAKRKPRIKKEDMVAKKPEKANIIEKEEAVKPKKAAEEVETVEDVEIVDGKSAKKTIAKKTVAKKTAEAVEKPVSDVAEAMTDKKKTAKAVEKEEKERLKKLDDKLEELLK